MVGDLVVAGEGRVDGGAAAHHVGEHAEDDQVADDHAHRPAQERVDAAAVAARAHVAADRPDRGGPLEDHLPGEQHQRPGDVEAVGEEGAVAGVGLLLGLDPADRQDHLVGLAGEQVAAAGPAVGEQPDRRSTGGARSRRSRRAPSRSSSSASPSRPSGRPGCPRSSRAGSRPGWRPSARRGRSPTRRAGSRARRSSGRGSARCRRASRCAGSAAPGRRSRGR